MLPCTKEEVEALFYFISNLYLTLYPIRTLSIPFPNFTAVHGVGVAHAKAACKHTIATRKCYQYNILCRSALVRLAIATLLLTSLMPDGISFLVKACAEVNKLFVSTIRTEVAGLCPDDDKTHLLTVSRHFIYKYWLGSRTCITHRQNYTTNWR